MRILSTLKIEAHVSGMELSEKFLLYDIFLNTVIVDSDFRRSYE